MTNECDMYGCKYEPTTKNDLGVENDLVGSIVETISEKVTETHEEFIFESIRPYCENVVQMKISKRDLEQALLKYYGKNDLGIDCKDCKWWKDSDGAYRRGVGAESQCPINRREVFEGSGYCYLFESQESEDK